MAYQYPGAPGASNVRNGNFSNREIHAYINIALPRADGSIVKIDKGLKLFADDPSSADLHNFLQTDQGKQWFAENAVITCNRANPDRAGFDFSMPEDSDDRTPAVG